MSSISNTLKSIDNTIDYVPVVSTIVNSINLLAKTILNTLYKVGVDKSYLDSCSISYLNDKSFNRIFFLALPIPLITNIVIAIYDAVNYCRKPKNDETKPTEQKTEKNENSENSETPIDNNEKKEHEGEINSENTNNENKEIQESNHNDNENELTKRENDTNLSNNQINGEEDFDEIRDKINQSLDTIEKDNVVSKEVSQDNIPIDQNQKIIKKKEEPHKNPLMKTLSLAKIEERKKLINETFGNNEEDLNDFIIQLSEDKNSNFTFSGTFEKIYEQLTIKTIKKVLESHPKLWTKINKSKQTEIKKDLKGLYDLCTKAPDLIGYLDKNMFKIDDEEFNFEFMKNMCGNKYTRVNAGSKFNEVNKTTFDKYKTNREKNNKN